MTKTEIKLAKAEYRHLKSALNTRQKKAAAEIKKRRAIIRQTEREISHIEADVTAYVKATSDRLAILEGRINS